MFVATTHFCVQFPIRCSDFFTKEAIGRLQNEKQALVIFASNNSIQKPEFYCTMRPVYFLWIFLTNTDAAYLNIALIWC